MNLAQRHFLLSILPDSYAIVGLSPGSEIPRWATEGSFFSITRTPDELSIVVNESLVPAGIQSQGGWRVMKVRGPFVLSEVGVLASLAGPLAAAKISAFVVSTFDTDYLLVANENLAPAVSTLERAGHSFQKGASE